MMFVELSKIANANLGYKSLQNTFFYLNEATIDTYGIERKYLTPMLMLADINPHSYVQSIKPVLWLFNCKDSKTDLRGTGAGRYIESMADRSATERKQTGKSQSIREALEAQSGGLWYAPKARPNRQHIWLRKAFSSVFAPFLFDEPALVDQRCNSISSLPGIEWKELAAVLTTSLFAYSLEINGAASMGAGALEAPTTKLRSYPVFDLTELKAADRKKLVALAEAVWAHESPIDWSAPDSFPGVKLRALDEWIIKTAGRNVKLDTVYTDIKDVCLSRIAVAKDKTKKTKKKHIDNIGSVADSIVKAIMPKIQIKSFPDDFTDITDSDIGFTIDRQSLKYINISQFLDSFDIEIISIGGSIIYKGTHSQFVAEAIVRSILWGRSTFSVSSDRDAMEKANTKFLNWFSEIEHEITKAITDSALGTGYEDALKREVYKRLGIHPLLGTKVLPTQITFS